MLTERLSAVEKPDVIGITSGMTYWYPGLFKVIELIKRSFKEVPILLGGIYATLCHDHALKFSGADFVIQGKGEAKILDVISELTQFRFTPNSERTLRAQFKRVIAFINITIANFSFTC